MGKGHYLGGSTLIRPGSDWFGYSEPNKPKRKRTRKCNPRQSSGVAHMSRQERQFEADERRKAQIAAESEARKAARAAPPTTRTPKPPRPQKRFVVERGRSPRMRPR